MDPCCPRFPKKRRLGLQKGSRSLGPEKLLKIISCATIKETKMLRETMVGVQVDLASGHQDPPGSSLLVSSGNLGDLNMVSHETPSRSPS